MSFKDIKGQDKAIELLVSGIKQKRLAHAYLFAGPESIGKGKAAQTLAKTLNCEEEKLDSCDKCPSCRKIDNGNHPDVHWISPEGRGDIIKIEKIRWLRQNISLKPYEAKAKFYIIDKAHKMNDAASNALLKTLEEPPANSILILISQNPERLFYTIKSRCQTIRFKSMNPNELAGILKERLQLSDDAGSFLACFSSGRIGNAIALKEKNIPEWKNRLIDTLINDASGLDEGDLYSDGSKTKLREGLSETLNMLAVWYRDILVMKNTDEESLIMNKDRLNDLRSAASGFSRQRLLDILEEIRKADSLIQQNVNPKLVLTSLVSQMED